MQPPQKHSLVYSASITLSSIGLIVGLGATFIYLNSLSGLIGSDFPDAGLVQFGMIVIGAMFAIPSFFVALIGFLLSIRTDDRRLKDLGLIAIAASLTFGSVHTISLGFYLYAVAIIALLIFLHRKSRSGGLLLTFLSLFAVCFYVGLWVFIQHVNTSPFIDFLFFTTS